tara:strand:+ start:84 stop:323 length:240 start_codon:yes stop_codon:yes gene_type:complete
LFKNKKIFVKHFNRYGKAKGQSTIAEACDACPSGWSGAKNLLKSPDERCYPCDVGTYTSSAGQTKCSNVATPCDPGFFR